MSSVSTESKICKRCKKEFTKDDLIKDMFCGEYCKDGRQNPKNYVDRIWKKRKYCSSRCSYLGTTAERLTNIRLEKVKNLSDNECQLCHYKTEPRILEIHHILERCNGGTNDPGNLIVLCPNCHSLVHHGFLKINKKVD